MYSEIQKKQHRIARMQSAISAREWPTELPSSVNASQTIQSEDSMTENSAMDMFCEDPLRSVNWSCSAHKKNLNI